MARTQHQRPRTKLDRFIERHIARASTRTLERYARLLSPKQKLRRSPGWSFSIPATRNDLSTYTRRLIWARCRDEQLGLPVTVDWCAGVKLKLRLGNDVSWSVFVGGMYEPNELAFFAATLQPGMTVLDVGANEGLFTLVAASRVDTGGRVLAVEPSLREFDWLRANIALNQFENVEPVRIALYDHDGAAQLTRAGFGHEGMNAIGDRIANPGVAPAGSETVELEKLDTFAGARNLGRLDMVKLDAEGCEARILTGGLATIRRFKPLLLTEVAPEHLAAQGSSVDGLLELLDDLDYRVWIFDRDGGLRLLAGDERLSDNIVAAPAGFTPPTA